MNFLGTPQLRAGVDVLFFSKCLFLKHPSVHGGINLISFEKKVFLRNVLMVSPYNTLLFFDASFRADIGIPSFVSKTSLSAHKSGPSNIFLGGGGGDIANVL